MSKEVVIVDGKIKNLPPNVFDSSKIPPGFISKELVDETQFMAGMGLVQRGEYPAAKGGLKYTVTRLLWPQKVFVEGVSQILATHESGAIVFKTIGASPKGCKVNYRTSDGEVGQCSPKEFAELIGEHPTGKVKVKPKPKTSPQVEAKAGQAAMENERLRKDYAEGKTKIFAEVKNMEGTK